MLKADIQNGPHRKNEVEAVPQAESGPPVRPKAVSAPCKYDLAINGGELCH